MKRFTIILSILTLFSIVAMAEKSYDVEAVYEKEELPYGSKVMDNYNNIKDAKYLLVPADIRSGNYEVTVKRIDSNTYQVVGTDLIIITKYCYEYAYNEKAVLQYTGYSYTKGKLIFLK